MRDPAETIKRLNVIRIVALLDFALLIPLVIAALTHAEGVVSVLGPIHGAGFLALLGLCLHGASEGRWGLVVPGDRGRNARPPGRALRRRAHSPWTCPRRLRRSCRVGPLQAAVKDLFKLPVW